MIEAAGTLIVVAVLLALSGALPGVCMRAIVQMYPRNDVRRRELQAELYAVPPKFTSRMFWVGQQLEVAVFEGLIRGRWIAASRWLATRAISRVFRSQAIHSHLQDLIDDDAFPIWGLWWAVRECVDGSRQHWSLESGVQMHRDHPNTFWIPHQEEKATIAPGDHVKLCFRTNDGWGERMWVRVTGRIDRRMTGVLDNVPVGIVRLGAGDVISFTTDHVIDVDPLIWQDSTSAASYPPDRSPEGTELEAQVLRAVTKNSTIASVLRRSLIMGTADLAARFA